MIYYAISIDQLEPGNSINRNLRLGGFKKEESAIKALEKDKSKFGFVRNSSGKLVFWKGIDNV